MARYHIRPFESRDFAAIMNLEERVFGANGDETLGSYYVRLCCDFFADSCFVAEVEGKAVGYLLSFINNGLGYCTTLAVIPEFQGTRVTFELVKAFLRRVLPEVDAVWFTVEESNTAARKLHAMLGARELGVRDDFYGPGKPRIVSEISRATFEAMRPRYKKLGLIDEPAQSGENVIAREPAQAAKVA